MCVCGRAGDEMCCQKPAKELFATKSLEDAHLDLPIPQ